MRHGRMQQHDDNITNINLARIDDKEKNSSSTSMIERVWSREAIFKPTIGDNFEDMI